MNTIVGIENEENFVRCIDNKKYFDLSKHLQYFLRYLFPFVDASEKFHCFQTRNFMKPDICISLQSEMRYVSLKYGEADTVHNENILTFKKFLEENGISQEAINTYLLYHYGDGTTDGSGKRRLGSVEVRFHYEEEIKKLNEEFNQSKEFIKKFADRVMFQGVNPQANCADFIYHGDVDYGVFMSRYQLMQHIDKKNWDFMTGCVHIGPFVVRPHARYSNKEIRNEEHRHTVVVNYPKIIQDIMYIFPRYAFDENHDYNVNFHH